MSGVEFKPCGGTDASQTSILLPLGKSTVGRGPLLGIIDKRVSRNHGLMEVEDGKIKMMPTHTNPTFYQAKGAAKLSPLDKDVWQTLQHGDRVGLTPDQHIFEVIIHDRPINTSSQSLKTSMIESSPEKTPQKPANSGNAASTGNAVKADGDKKVEGQQNGDDKIPDEDKSTEDEEQKEEKSEKKTVADEKTQETETKEQKDDSKEDNKEESKEDEDTNGLGEESADDASQDKEKVETVKLEDGKEVALPVQKERTLPNWMDKAGAEKGEGNQPSTPKGKGRPKKAETPANAEGQEGETPVKRGRGRPKGSSPKGSAKKPKAEGKAKGKGRGRPRKRSGDDEDESLSPSSKGLNRGKRKKISDDYVDEEMEDHELVEEEEEEEAKVVFKDDDDWMISEEEVESDISDWENSQRSHKAKGKSKAKKTPGKRGRKPAAAKSPRTPSRRTASRGAKKKKSYFTDSEEDYFTDDDEIYVPKPTKRTAGRIASSQSQQSVGSGDGDGDDDDDHQPKKVMPRKTTPKAKKKKTTPVKKAAPANKKKQPCEYGSECYRKNPSHFKEFSHPEEADDKSPHSSEGEEEDDAGKEECPYGAECYRNNKNHLKQYRHPPPPASNRPKREAAQKKAVVIQGDRSSLLHSGVSDDDGAPNTYDDNDSFLDDAIMGSDQETEKDKGRASDDSDWSVGEAKGAKKPKVHVH